MPDLREIETLIRQASIRPALWRAVLQALEQRLAGSRCSLWNEPGGSGPGSAQAFRFTAKGMARSGEGSNGPGLADRAAAPVGRLVSLGGDVPLSGGVALILHRCDARLWSLAVEARPALDRDGAALAAAFLTRLRPIVAGSFRVRHAIGLGRVPARRDVGRAWDGLDHPALVIDRDRHVVSANMAAEDFLQSRALFQPPGASARMRFHAAEAEERFEDALHRILEGGSRRLAVSVTGRTQGSAGARITLAAPGPCFVTRSMGAGVSPPRQIVMTVSPA